MPRLKANFEADWISYLRECLANDQGWPSGEVSRLEDRNVPFHYFDALRRKITAAPRTVRLADDFVCPVEHTEGWHALQKKVQKGQDINPYLSKRHESLFNPDGLLNDWGIHHFHLGTTFDQKNVAYISRTGPLLYALVNGSNFCAIGILSHSGFEESCLIESIHRNWPDMISHRRANGIAGEELTPTQRQALRKKNGNVATAVSDSSVYLPPSGGITSSGVVVDAVRNADSWRNEIRAIQKAFEEKFFALLPLLRDNGYADESEIEAKLLFSEKGPQVFFPKYQVLATLGSSPEWL